MRLSRVELRVVALPLVTPFRTAHGEETEKSALLLRADTDCGEGWGVCAALPAPTYTSEYLDGALEVLRRWLVPALAGDGLGAAEVASRCAGVRGHRMAKAALELALLDAESRAAGRSLAEALGGVRDRVPAGVAVGLCESTDELLAAVESYLREGYRRVKLKIAPGHDVVPVAAVRERFGPELALQVDANGAYTRADIDDLVRLDDLGLAMIEQPFDERDVVGHVELARRLVTPVCLDESVVSAAVAAELIDGGACSVVNVKPGRVGGYLEARRVHDVCVARGVPAWCGGMLETGLGRAANVALAALPGFTLPGDLSASGRYFARDLTPPLELVDGCLEVPTGPGIGVEVDRDALEAFTTRVETVDLGV